MLISTFSNSGEGETWVLQAGCLLAGESGEEERSQVNVDRLSLVEWAEKASVLILDDDIAALRALPRRSRIRASASTLLA